MRKVVTTIYHVLHLIRLATIPLIRLLNGIDWSTNPKIRINIPFEYK
jgi:hypothetical protein